MQDKYHNTALCTWCYVAKLMPVLWIQGPSVHVSHGKGVLNGKCRAGGSSPCNQNSLSTGQESTLQNQAPCLCEKGTLQDLHVPLCSARQAVMDLLLLPWLASPSSGSKHLKLSPLVKQSLLKCQYTTETLAHRVHHDFQAVCGFVSPLSATDSSFSGRRYVIGYGCNYVYWQWTSLLLLRWFPLHVFSTVACLSCLLLCLYVILKLYLLSAMAPCTCSAS